MTRKLTQDSENVSTPQSSGSTTYKFSRLKHNLTRQTGGPIIHCERPFSEDRLYLPINELETNSLPQETTEWTTRPDTLRIAGLK